MAFSSSIAADTTTDDAVLRPPLWSAAPRALWPLAVGALFAFLISQFLAPELGGFASLLAFAGINIVLAVSLNIVNGFAGQFSIGHAGFMSLGGYIGSAVIYYGTYRVFGDFRFHGGWLSYDGPARSAPVLPIGPGELLFIGGCIVGGIVSAAAGWLVGLPSLRLRGDYLAIVTLGFGEIVRVLLEGTPNQIGPRGLEPVDIATLNDKPFFSLLNRVGGAQAFNGLPTYATVFWIFVWVAAVLIVAVRLKRSGYGRALLSVREDEVAARSVGVDVTRYNVRAFMLSSFFAGVAGVLSAMNIGQIKAGDLGFQRSFEVVIMVVLGGLGSISGSVLAAVLLTVLPELLRDPPSLFPFGLPVVLVAGVLILLRARRPARGLIVFGTACAVYEFVRFEAPRLNISLSDYRMIFYSLALILLMILRPQGLFGVHEVWEVWPLKAIRFRRGVTQSASKETSLAPADSDVVPAVPVLEVRDIGIRFGGLTAVRNLSISLTQNGLDGLIGPNGAGKTTCFNLLTGIYRPDSGQVILGGVSLVGRKPHRIAREGFARTFQNIRLFGELTVLDNVRLGAQMRHRLGLPSTLLRSGHQIFNERMIRRDAEELLSIFGLANRAGEQAKNLPYGDQRRLEIARALATRPKVLLLDEPAAGMNPQEKVELMELIRFVRDRFRVGILLIEHDMKLVMSICQRITVLDHGETIAVGTPEQIQCDPKVIEAYLGEPG